MITYRKLAGWHFPVWTSLPPNWFIYILGQRWPSFQVYWLQLEVQILFGITEVSKPLCFNPRAVLCLPLYFEASSSEQYASISATSWELPQFLCPEDGVTLSKSRLFGILFVLVNFWIKSKMWVVSQINITFKLILFNLILQIKFKTRYVTSIQNFPDA